MVVTAFEKGERERESIERGCAHVVVVIERAPPRASSGSRAEKKEEFFFLVYRAERWRKRAFKL